MNGAYGVESAIMPTEDNFSLMDLNEKFPAAIDYLKEIFLVNRDYGLVKNSVIARRLGVTKPAVTQAMKRLKKFNLIDQDLYSSIYLTPRGRRFAVKVLKRHYLIELLLIDRLDYPWVKSDEEASRIQATLSDDFTDYLFEKLGSPETCPHGNPMPGSLSENEILSAPRLSESRPGTSVKVVRITEEGEAVERLLQFCYESRIRPGTQMKIEDNSGENVRVFIEKEAEAVIPLKYADYICFSPE